MLAHRNFRMSAEHGDVGKVVEGIGGSLGEEDRLWKLLIDTGSFETSFRGPGSSARACSGSIEARGRTDTSMLDLRYVFQSPSGGSM